MRALYASLTDTHAVRRPGAFLIVTPGLALWLGIRLWTRPSHRRTAEAALSD